MLNEREHFDYYNHDDRSKFANRIFQLIYNKYQGDFANILMLQEAAEFVESLDEYVRNIYEVIDSEIPMMAYIQVHKHGADGYCEWEEYTTVEALNIIEGYCHRFYSLTDKYKAS